MQAVPPGDDADADGEAAQSTVEAAELEAQDGVCVVTLAFGSTPAASRRATAALSPFCAARNRSSFSFMCTCSRSSIGPPPGCVDGAGTCVYAFS